MQTARLENKGFTAVLQRKARQFTATVSFLRERRKRNATRVLNGSNMAASLQSSKRNGGKFVHTDASALQLMEWNIIIKSRHLHANQIF